LVLLTWRHLTVNFYIFETGKDLIVAKTVYTERQLLQRAALRDIEKLWDADVPDGKRLVVQI